MFYSIRFYFVRSWYFAPARLFWPLATALLLSFVAFDAKLKAARLINRIVITGLILIISYNSLLAVKNCKLASEATNNAAQFVVMSDWINENLPKDTVVGAYSSGILSYFSERKVVNLDGLSNNSIYMASRNRAMDKFIDSMNIDYLADYESITMPNRTCGLLMDGDPSFVKNRLKEVYRMKCSSEYGDLVVYKILPKINDEQ